VRRVTTSDADSRKQGLWKSLADAGLVEIALDEFPRRIRDVKQTVIVRLSELLQKESNWRERESVAYSLGTLTKLESKVEAKTTQDQE
jgi:hypothetical protein